MYRFWQSTVFPAICNQFEKLHHNPVRNAPQDRFAVNQGNIVGQDIGRSPGFAVISLNASRRFGEHFRLSAGIDNLFNKTYAEHISRAGSAVAGFAQTTRVNEPGRTAWLKLDASF